VGGKERRGVAGEGGGKRADDMGKGEEMEQ